MSLTEQILTVAAAVLATMLTRFLPFIIFGVTPETPKFVQYLGKVLPCAIFALLVVYCVRNVDVFSNSHGLPEFSIIATISIHLILRQFLISMAFGTAVYMLLIQFVFV